MKNYSFSNSDADNFSKYEADFNKLTTILCDSFVHFLFILCLSVSICSNCIFALPKAKKAENGTFCCENIKRCSLIF